MCCANDEKEIGTDDDVKKQIPATQNDAWCIV